LAATRRLQTVTTTAAVRAAVQGWRAAGERVAFVPTMGNLHAGHASLAALAAANAGRVVMSIFVNPTQFGPSEDFSAYPRTLAEDSALARDRGDVDLLFVPEVAEVYPFGAEDSVRVLLPALSRELCGASRPGHFDGVASVVLRLLDIVAPDVLWLGQKDYQQYVLIQRMLEDLKLPVVLRMGATSREPDGLAMSSRNRYLDAAERARAPALHAALAEVRAALHAGREDWATVLAEARRALERAGFEPDYVELRRAADLAAPRGAAGEALVVLGAGRLGRVRLIDNLLV
jgi:pantoate--beta-alanine ligase